MTIKNHSIYNTSAILLLTNGLYDTFKLCKTYSPLLENNGYKATSIHVLTNDINSALKQYNNDTQQAFQSVANKYNVDIKSLFNFWNMRDTKTWYGNKWARIDPNNDMVILNKKPFKIPIFLCFNDLFTEIKYYNNYFFYIKFRLHFD